MNKKPLYQNIVIVIDGSDASFHAAEHALALGKALGSRLTAVSVVDTELLNRLLQTRIFVQEEREEYEHDLEQSGQMHLEHVAMLAKKQGVPIEILLLKGSMHRIIIAQVESLHADLIVLGKWRYSRTERDIIAVERQRILIEAPCPVLVVD